MPISNPHLVSRFTRLGALGLTLLVVAGCQSLSSTTAQARVRVIDVSPDAPAIDIYQGNAGVAYNMSYGTMTSYLPMTPGPSTLTVNVAGSRQVLSTIDGTFAADTHYTVLVSNSVVNLQQIVLSDRGAAPSGKAPVTPFLRFINQAGRTNPVDIYLVPTGRRLASVTPIVTNLAPGSSTSYLGIPACTCAVVMLPAGSPPTTVAAAVHSGAQMAFAAGSARTLILLDAPASASSSVQVVTTLDAEPLP